MDGSAEGHPAEGKRWDLRRREMWGTTGGWKKGKIINMDFILKDQMR